MISAFALGSTFAFAANSNSKLPEVENSKKRVECTCIYTHGIYQNTINGDITVWEQWDCECIIIIVY